MLDIVIYGHNDQGRLTLKERSFTSLHKLAAYFSTPEAARWQWAEVASSTFSGHPQVVRYSADTLRAMGMAGDRRKNANSTKPCQPSCQPLDLKLPDLKDSSGKSSGRYVAGTK